MAAACDQRHILQQDGTIGITNYYEDKRWVAKMGKLLTCAPKGSALAIAASTDLVMDSGMLLDFKNKFNQTEELKKQQRQVGGFAIGTSDKSYPVVYYLMGKKLHFGCATTIVLKFALRKMAEDMQTRKVEVLCLPKLAKEDKVEWEGLKLAIKNILAQYEYPKVVHFIDV